MKQNTFSIIFIFLLLTAVAASKAQLCNSPVDTIYGLNSITGSGSGQIIGVNVLNAGTALIGSPAASSANANGLAYSNATERFYFFNQSGAGATEFVSFDPLTGAQSSLAIPSSPALPTTTTGKIRSGAINVAGDAYYTIFPGASTTMGYPLNRPAFYYYNIPANTWTLITQSFRDISGIIVNEIRTLNSGDMAFDGFGRLWIVSSNNANYALYRINGPLPTTAVASVTVDTIIPAQPTPAGVSITGIAFNSSGDLFLSSGSGAGAGNNILYKMIAAASPLSTVGTLPNGAGDDLTSCIHPFEVLPVSYFQFNSGLNKNAIELIWKADELNDVSGYDIEYSNDAVQWQKIAFASKNTGTARSYSYNHYDYRSGNNYYRIAQLSNSRQKKYSSIQKVTVDVIRKIYISANLVNNTINIYGKNLPSKYIAQIFDNTGRLVFSGKPEQNNQSVDISNLHKGMYLIRFSTSSQDADLGTYKFVKY